jgi:hypothetical protein
MNADRFFSHVAGFSLTKAPAWVFGTAEWEAAARSRTSVGTREIDEAIRERARLPLVIVSRYPEPNDRPNPTLKVGVRPLGELRGKSAAEIARVLVDLLKPSMRAFALDGEIAATEVDGLPAAEFRTTFEAVVEGTVYPVRARTWIVPRGAHLFIIGAAEPATGGTSAADFERMVATIQIRRDVEDERPVQPPQTP